VDTKTLIGSVQDVAGNSVRVALTNNTITGFVIIDGEGYYVGQVGGFVRIPIGFISLYGVISQVGAGAVPDSQKIDNPFGSRWISIQLVGECKHGGKFQRGISQYPTIDDPVHLVTVGDLRNIYGAGDSDEYVSVGSIASSESIPALVNINKLVTRHSAVVGSTGSGKSTTVASLLRSISDASRYPSSRIIVFDVHGEYARALKSRAAVYKVSPSTMDTVSRPLFVPYWALSCEELIKISMGSIESKEYSAIQERILTEKLKVFDTARFNGLDRSRITADTPIPFSIHKLWYDLHCEINATHYEKNDKPQSRDTWAVELDKDGNELLGKPSSAIPPTFKPLKDVKGDDEKIRLSKSPLSIRRQIDTLGSKLRDPRFDFIFQPGKWQPTDSGQTEQDLDSLLEGWLGSKNPISILDLSGIPPTVMTDLIGALLRIVYDALFWGRNIAEGGRERPILVVLEEAHLYLSKDNSGNASSAVKRIAKEGRKYGVGLMIVSQRPSEVDSTILSQCGTIVALRLSNDLDRGQVTSAATDNLKGLFDMLPSLRTGEAIIVGESVSLPMRALIKAPPPNERPDSADPDVTVKMHPTEGYEKPGGWNQPHDKEDYAILVKQWRSQNPIYLHERKKTEA